MRRNGKRDDNEPEIVAALRGAGCLVQPLMQGDGVPDLLVCTPGGNLLLLEVKDGPKKKLTPDQARWHAQWERAMLYTVTSVDEALEAIQIWKPREPR